MRIPPKTSLFLTAAFVCGCKSVPPPESPGEPSEVKSFVYRHRGIVRDVAVTDPRTTSSEKLRPLVVVLHGGLGEDDDTVALSFGKLNRLASEDDFIVVYPEGVGGHWNDGRNVRDYAAQRERLDDVGFLASLVEHLIETRQIDPAAVFVVGVSDGAMMAHRFACERTELLRAFSAVIGAMPYNVALRRSRCGTKPVSVLMINGTDDPIVPWEGGEVQFDGATLGRVISVEKTFRFWAKQGGCEGVETSMIPDFSPNDGSRIQRHKAAGCVEGTKVELLEVQGAGHTWPAGWQYLPEHMIGKTSHDIDASIATWRFFQSTL